MVGVGVEIFYVYGDDFFFEFYFGVFEWLDIYEGFFVINVVEMFIVV